jgi:heptaprenyl diphosphate synthase
MTLGRNRQKGIVIMSIKKLSLMAILTAVALIIFVIEAQIPLPVPVPGVKLGISNAVTLFALFYSVGTQGDGTQENRPPVFLTTANVFAILLCRIILGAMFTGRLVAFFYSLAGGVLALTVQVIMKRFVTEKQIWVCGAAGAVFHNIGQIIAAIMLTGTPAIAAYLPVLIVAGVFTGVLTGLIAQFTLERIQKQDLNNK